MDLLFHGGRSGEKTGEGLCRIPIGSVTTARRARTVSAPQAPVVRHGGPEAAPLI